MGEDQRALLARVLNDIDCDMMNMILRNRLIQKKDLINNSLSSSYTFIKIRGHIIKTDFLIYSESTRKLLYLESQTIDTLPTNKNRCLVRSN